jgi:O-antigen/teichoic acid export membrane protein
MGVTAVSAGVGAAVADVAPGRRGTAQPRLARGIVLNVIGLSAPLAVAYFAIPVLATSLGTERFGVLTLAWAVLGYASFFDFGLGRALTQAVAERVGRGELGAVVPVVRAAMRWMAALGAVGALALALAAPALVTRGLGVSTGLVAEARPAAYLLAASVPLVIVTAGLRGVLEGLGRFGAVNALRVPMGVLTFLAPLAVLPSTRHLAAVVGVLLAARALALGAHAWVVARALRAFPPATAGHASADIPRLLRAGSWMTVSNVVGPLVVSLDRFLIAGMASAAVVAYYTAPYEAVTKLWLIPGALTGVLFPAFAAAAAGGAGAERLLEKGIRATLASLLPVTFVIVLLARDGLAAWLGGEYPARSTHVVQLLAVGVLLNGVAQVPFVLLQGAGKAEWTAKLHLAELPLYVLLAGWLIGRWGVTGAAVAWALRCAVDTAAVLALAGRVTRLPARVAAWLVGSVGTCGVAAVLASDVAAVPLGVRLALGALGASALFAVLVRGLGVGDRLRGLPRRTARA